MNSGSIAVALAAVIVASGIAYAFLREKGAVADGAAKPASAPASVVQVDDLADRPDEFQGELVLKGVVARVNKSKGVLSVIDFREFEACGQVGCARNYLPVKFDGELPEPKTVVQLTGRVVRTDKGLVFQAERMEAE